MHEGTSQCNSPTSRDELIVVVCCSCDPCFYSAFHIFSSIFVVKQLGIRKNSYNWADLQTGRAGGLNPQNPKVIGEKIEAKIRIQIKSSHHQPISSHSLYQVSPTSTLSPKFSQSLFSLSTSSTSLSTSPSAPPLRRLHDLFEGRHAHHGVPKVQLQQLRATKAALASAGSGRTANGAEGGTVRRNSVVGNIEKEKTWRYSDIIYRIRKPMERNWERWNKQSVDKIPRLWDTIGKKNFLLSTSKYYINLQIMHTWSLRIIAQQVADNGSKSENRV